MVYNGQQVSPSFVISVSQCLTLTVSRGWQLEKCVKIDSDSLKYSKTWSDKTLGLE